MRRFGSMITVVTLAAVLTACGKPQDEAATGPATPPAPQLTDAEKQAVLASLPAPYNTGDLVNGKAKFALCQSCHTIVQGGPNMTGPNLYGVFGRKAATGAGYTYSPALKEAGFVWDAARLDEWLANPRTYLPGTKMTFAGVKDAKDRVDLIAFLKVETGYKP